MRNELLKDRVVVGIKDDKTRNLLFAEPNLYLERAVELFWASWRSWKGGSGTEKRCWRLLAEKQTNKKAARAAQWVKQVCILLLCTRKEEMSGVWQKCAKCGKRNHFAIVCKEESDEESDDEHNKVHEVDYEEYDQEGKN